MEENKVIKGGCIDCRHNCSTYLCTKPGVSMNVSLVWWELNGSKGLDDNKVDELSCFEPTNMAIALNKMSGLLDKMISLTK